MLHRVKLPFFMTLVALSACLLSGCDLVLFQPEGVIAKQEMHLIIIAVLLMLLVVLPVIVMTVIISWRYRASNTKATYTPDWDHSTKLEVIWWGVPCIIVSILASITWVTSHTLDPYRPLVSDVKPVTIQAVSLDWKWLFIYPEQGIATVNVLHIPEGTPINFQVTADAPMNSLWIPALGGQIYSMPGMRTKLHLMADHAGVYDGLGASFTGDGFANMMFKVNVVSTSDFSEWVSSVQQQTNPLTQEVYDHLAKPTEREPVQYFSTVKDGLFNDIMMKFMMPAGSDHHHMSMMMQEGM